MLDRWICHFRQSKDSAGMKADLGVVLSILGLSVQWLAPEMGNVSLHSYLFPGLGTSPLM